MTLLEGIDRYREFFCFIFFFVGAWVVSNTSRCTMRGMRVRLGRYLGDRLQLVTDFFFTIHTTYTIQYSAVTLQEKKPGVILDQI